VSVRALPDAHLGWSGPNGVNNKQANYGYRELARSDIAAEYMEQIKFRQMTHGTPPLEWEPSKQMQRRRILYASEDLL